ncbi:TIGR01459 family HAD-type hydrolase [Paracoccus aerodenitrificans]|uniref:TIGR01459 family HAD-type hydrolase n=1 Tax=Paracoccus aerodenitrificans TaxID=3017781 RepID=UPI0022EFDE40|nr:TIGR01459 family HAD-type hydrolase [Paracoccus aerodenitrificans]WBU63107.1 TIGR01459 family HAD-type hydrolase [Paracoccus aerodenitrificans]
MTRIINALAGIAPNYDVLFCDLWGCVHNGIQAYPAAVAALQEFRHGGGQVCLMTNAPRPAPEVIASFGRLGVPDDAWDDVVTSGDAAQDALFSGALGRRVWHLGPSKDDSFFDAPAEWRDAAPIERVSLEDAEGIVCTGPFDEATDTPEDYRGQLMLAREKGLKLLCANPDLVVDLGERRIYCAGAIAEFYQELGGESLYFGKPHPPIYDLARRRLNLRDGARILVIGDGINTDIRGAVGEGLDSVFITGGLAAGDMGGDVENPEPGLLEEWLQQKLLDPTWAMGRLR